MIVHVLLGKPREDLSSDQTQELTETIRRLSEVPGVEEFTFGQDFSGRGKGYTWAAVMHFASREALTNYAQHGLHLQIVETLNRLMPDRLVIDYQTGSNVMGA